MKITLDSVSLFAITFLMPVISWSVYPSDSKAAGGGAALWAAAVGTEVSGAGAGAVAGFWVPAAGGDTCTTGAGFRPLSLMCCSKSLKG